MSKKPSVVLGGTVTGITVIFSLTSFFFPGIDPRIKAIVGIVCILVVGLTWFLVAKLNVDTEDLEALDTLRIRVENDWIHPFLDAAKATGENTDKAKPPLGLEPLYEIRQGLLEKHVGLKEALADSDHRLIITGSAEAGASRFLA